MKEKKFPKKSNSKKAKTIPDKRYSTDNEYVVWCFDMLDKTGEFAFDLERKDFDHKEILGKIIDYSNMTWSQIKEQTHDRGKSKHHLLDFTSLSKEAQECIKRRKLDDRLDSIFSFAFQNKLRIIGIRQHEKFHAVWFDPQHKFCPSKK